MNSKCRRENSRAMHIFILIWKSPFATLTNTAIHFSFFVYVVCALLIATVCQYKYCVWKKKKIKWNTLPPSSKYSNTISICSFNTHKIWYYERQQYAHINHINVSAKQRHNDVLIAYTRTYIWSLAHGDCECETFT